MPNATKKAPRPAKPLLEQVTEDGNSSFARALGSVDYHTREKGVQALTAWLSRRSSISELDMAKVWKGLFYCFWHSDKAPVQEDLATRLAGILPKLSPEVAHSYFHTFLTTMQREWFGIDRLRLDKFMVLVRKFVQQLFVHLQASSWDKKMLAQHSNSLHELLKRSDDLPAASLSFHLADISVPELLTVLKQGEKRMPEAALRQMLDMYAEVLARSTRESLLTRLRTGVFEPVIEELRTPSSSKPLFSLDTVSLSEHIFALGADPVVRVKNRGILYELSSALEKAGGKKRKAESNSMTVEDTTGNRESPRSPMKEAKGPADDQPTASKSPKQAPEMASGKSMTKRETKAVTKALAEAAEQAPDSQLRTDALAKADRPRSKQQEQQAASAGPSTVLTNGLPKIKTKATDRDATAAEGDSTPKGSRVEVAAGNGILEGQKAAQEAQLGLSPRAKKKAKKAKGLGTEAVTRAAERTLAAMNAHARGETTVRPATPGSPSEVSFDAWFSESLATQGSPRSLSRNTTHAVGTSMQRRALSAATHASPAANGSTDKASASAKPLSRFAKDGGRPSSGVAGTPHNTEVTPGSSVKRVKFALKRNISLAKGQPVPPESIRTPTQLKPRGSALKKVSSIRPPRSPRSLPPPFQTPRAGRKKMTKPMMRMLGTI